MVDCHEASNALAFEHDWEMVGRLGSAPETLKHKILRRVYPLTYGETSIDYEMVKLSGLDAEFLLPARAESIQANHGQKRYYRNVMYYKGYRKFETDIKIEGAVTPPQKPPR